MTQVRQAGYDINPLFLQRWSARAFTNETISREQLLGLFEAARWAPSAYNAQPWRFIYALKDSPQWSSFLDLLIEFNRSWASKAAALVFIVSRTQFQAPGKDTASPFPTHAFDSGAAWASLALQAQDTGWSAHAMAGFDQLRAREVLGIPDDYAIQAAIAIGRPGNPESLPEGLRAREFPSHREPLEQLIAEGRFNFPA
jgi:nitroreductase